MKVAGKVFVVTGAGGGIGSELALTLLEKGAQVAAVDLREDSLQALAERAGEKAGNLSTHAVNITDRAAVEKLAKEVVAKQGSVDGVINNAGIIQPFVKVNELEYEAIERVMNVNFYGALYMTKAFLPLLLTRSEAHIANVSSMGGFLPVPGQSIYGASKAAVKLMTEGLYAELRDTNVGVSVIFPGAINTNITNNSGVKMKAPSEKSQKIPMTQPNVAAEVIVRGIEKGQARIFVGGDSRLMDLLYRLNPVFATNLIAKQMKSLLEKS